MSQNDMVIANAAGSVVRADVNSALQALATLSSGTSSPSTTYAGQSWWDTTNNLLKIRNGANSAWITIASFDGSTFLPYVLPGETDNELLRFDGTAGIVQGTGVTIDDSQVFNGVGGINFGDEDLSYYDEAGNFTAEIEGSATPGTPTYASQLSGYTRVGNICFFALLVGWLNLGGAAGSIRISGLPFTVRGQSGSNIGSIPLSTSEYSGISLSTGKTLMPLAQAGTDYITLNQGGDTDALDELNESEATAAGVIYVSGFFFI